MPDAPPCEKCSGRQHVRTLRGWKPCACYWHSRVMRETPTVLQAGDLSLPDSVTSAAPWSVAEDRFEQGDWNTFRLQAWWSLAHHIQAGSANAAPLKVDAISTQRLKEISFNRDETYVSTERLLAVDLIILIAGVIEVMHQRTVDDISATLLRSRRLYRKPTWTFGLAPVFAQLPLFYQHGCTSGVEPVQAVQALPTGHASGTLPAAPALPADFTNHRAALDRARRRL